MNARVGDLAGRGGFTSVYQSVMLKRPAKASHLLRQPNPNGSNEDHVMADRQLPSPEVLRQRLSYDPETGNLLWNEIHEESSGAKMFNVRYAGKPAGCLTEKGYYKVRVGGKKYYAHRVAWAIHYGEWPKDCLDHINHNGTDNRIENLRSVSRAENAKNRPPQKNSKFFVGVYWHKECSKWAAGISHKGQPIHLGLHVCLGKAIKARRKEERVLGFHPRHGGLA